MGWTMGNVWPCNVNSSESEKRGDMENKSGAHRRCRLPADIRVNQILDAALAEFSARGFTSTRIDDIAARAGLSKGGVYTHFGSKGEVFQALLRRLLITSILDERALVQGAVTAERVIGLLSGKLYTWSTSEPVVTTLRLLIAENLRLPDLVEQWQIHTENAYVGAIGKMLKKGVKEGHLRRGAATQTPSLLIAPIAHMCLRQAIRATPVTKQELARHRRAYARMLRELLALPAPHQAARTQDSGGGRISG